MNQPCANVVATRAAVILFLFGAAVNLPAQSPAPSSADVPVKEVVLFSSGVGYFQHEGTVNGDAGTQLRFKTGQINDILKSLVLQDLGGGRIGVVTYPSQDPLAKTLSSFQVDLSDNPSLGDLLNKLRGAKIAFTTADKKGQENDAGTILGVEKRATPGGKEGETFEKEFLNILTDKGIRSIALEHLESFQLEDTGLQNELNRALAAIAGARDHDKKPVDLRFTGTGERKVRVGYVVETPVWKASYRLVLAGENPADRKPKASLQGWAVVENQTDNDWNNVRLSLVSGRPISFTENLYQPLYVPRPEVKPELYASLTPQTYEGGQTDAAEQATRDRTAAADLQRNRSTTQRREAMKSAAAAPASTSPSSAAVDADERVTIVGSNIPTAQEPGNIDLTSSIQAISDTAKIGELFQYTVGNVSLARQRSAMIPIINDPIEVEKVSIFNQAVLGTHPLNGARLKNNTQDAKHLLGGPVTVFDDGRYAGDAQLDNVPPGETRLLSYGIDLQVSAVIKDLDASKQQNVVAGKIVKGALLVTRKYDSTKEYSFENKGDHDKTIVIEHPLRTGWKLVDTAKPVETTNALYRFEQNVGAGKSEHLTVREENVQSQSVSMLPMDVSTALYFSQTGEIPRSVRDALTKAIALKQAAATTQSEINERSNQISTLTSDQSRMRENLKSVDRTTSYATRLLKKLDDQESQIDKLRNETESLRNKMEGQQRELATYLENLNVE